MSRHKPSLRPYRVGSRVFDWTQRTYVMGIVNVTPDSFSGDGLLGESTVGAEEAVQRAVAQAQRFVKEGADIIDVGAESTRPGAQIIDADTETRRIVPVIRSLREQSDVPISIDTYKASVARAAMEAGADLVNDVWGLQMDASMADVVREHDVPVILMHNRSKPQRAEQQERLGGRYVGVRYENLMADVIGELCELVRKAVSAGIARERIIIDPGIGFGKTVEQNLALMNHVDELCVLGLPILLGPSRKSFIGYTLDLPPDQRVEGTAAAVAMGIVRGANIVRVHDVQAMVRTARMVDAIIRAKV